VALVLQAALLQDTTGTDVGGVTGGGDTVQTQRAEGEGEHRGRRFRRVPVAPGTAGQHVAELAAGVDAAGDPEFDGADQFTVVLDGERVGAASRVHRQGEEMFRVGDVVRAPVHVADHLGVAGVGVHSREVPGAEPAQPQTGGGQLDHAAHGSRTGEMGFKGAGASRARTCG
jgi:hypothetical protein